MSINKCECSNCVIKNLFVYTVKDSDLEKICLNKVQKKYKKGEIIISSEKDVDILLCIKSGLAKYYRILENNKQYIIGLVKPFDIITYLVIFLQKEDQFINIAAVEDTEVCFVPIKEIEQIIRTNSNFAIDVIRKIVQASNDVIKRFTTINNKNLKGRIAWILLDFADNIYKKDIFELPMSRKEIGEMIGMTTENVIRTLSEFRKEKIIKINGKEIEIIEKNKLKTIAQYG